MHCYLHICRNFEQDKAVLAGFSTVGNKRNKDANMAYLHFLIAEAVRAPTQELHSEVLCSIGRCNQAALSKLNAIPVEVYAMFVKYREGVRMLGTITSNDAEQEMMRLKKSKIRKGKPFEVLTNVMNLWVRLINEASTESQTLLDEGKFLTKYALKGLK